MYTKTFHDDLSRAHKKTFQSWWWLVLVWRRRFSLPCKFQFDHKMSCFLHCAWVYNTYIRIRCTGRADKSPAKRTIYTAVKLALGRKRGFVSVWSVLANICERDLTNGCGRCTIEFRALTEWSSQVGGWKIKSSCENCMYLAQDFWNGSALHIYVMCIDFYWMVNYLCFVLM